MPNVTEIVFIAVPAFVEQVIGGTHIKFSISETDFDPTHLIEVDLANDCSLPPEQWETNVEVDSTTSFTSIGPTFPVAFSWVGAVYLSKRLFDNYKAKSILANWPPEGDSTCQYTAIVRSDGTKYHGFKVKVLASQGSLLKVAFINPGVNDVNDDSIVRWIDINDPSVVDPIHPTLDSNAAPNSLGELFIEVKAGRNLNLVVPKLPSGFQQGDLPMIDVRRTGVDKLQQSLTKGSLRLLQ